MARFIVGGKDVSQPFARELWYMSDVYKNANRKTRDSIFHIAVYGDKNGNHNPNGEVEHLEEAGIILK